MYQGSFELKMAIGLDRVVNRTFCMLVFIGQGTEFRQSLGYGGRFGNMITYWHWMDQRVKVTIK